MQSNCIAILLILTAAAQLHAEEEIVYLDLRRSNEAVERYVAQFTSPTRELTLLIRETGGNRSKSQSVRVTGPIGDASVEALTRFVLTAEPRTWSDKASWAIAITGDEKWAAAKIDFRCGVLCGFRATRWFGSQADGWYLHYESDSAMY